MAEDEEEEEEEEEEGRERTGGEVDRSSPSASVLTTGKEEELREAVALEAAEDEAVSRAI